MLAEAVGPAGQVTGLDASSEHLRFAEGMVERAGRSSQISFQQGDVADLLFDDGTFDWAWSANCVGYATVDPLPLVKELARVVKPEGCVAILAWSSERLLPGYPLLEARLSATTARLAPFAVGRIPEVHFMRAMGWFREAGLEDITAHTFAGDVHAPLSETLRNALIALFQMRWPGAESELTPEDRAEYRRLCLPESPDLILNHPDYYAFFTYSMFCGRVAT
jgi:demethylmenaquinone methyltransferase/2-methoxy-6-polyprenyl-1,4-benzoquinol methylase